MRTANIHCLDRASLAPLMRSPGSSLSERIPAIYAHHDELAKWWQKVPPNLKLSSTNIAVVPWDALPNVLLINVVYHQSLCALHASIVPLFSWDAGDESWSSARQLSAQVAFEHACETSALISAVLTTYPKLSAMPSFVAYAAYSGCAIQIPFLWCLNEKVRQQAHANVKANIDMIHAMANYWKFAAMLVWVQDVEHYLNLLTDWLIRASTPSACTIYTRGTRLYLKINLSVLVIKNLQVSESMPLTPEPPSSNLLVYLGRKIMVTRGQGKRTI